MSLLAVMLLGCIGSVSAEWFDFGNDNQENNNPESNHGQNFTDRLGKITDLINDVADGRRSRNNQQQNNNYYNDQPLNNVFADDPNEELAKKTNNLDNIKNI